MPHPLDTCAFCGATLPARASTGRPRLYCSERCRHRAYRSGMTRSQTPREGYEKIVPPSPPARLKPLGKDDIVQLIVNACAVESAFRFAAERGHWRTRGMCLRIADAIAAALEAERLRM